MSPRPNTSRRWTWRPPAGWPLLVLAAPAVVAIWSGWVGLGQMAGFGPVHPLPGIADHVVVNTAITLPIGVEAYSAYAMGVWLSPRRMRPLTRWFAAGSSLAALGLGLVGQVLYHLLTSWGHTSAPWGVVVFVACLPVLVLGAGATLHHLISQDRTASPVTEATSDRAVTSVEKSAPQPMPTGPVPALARTGQAALPAAKPAKHQRARTRTKRTQPRRTLADYLADARAALAAAPAGTDPTPAWCIRATGCSDGTSIKLARALRAEQTEQRTNPDTKQETTNQEVAA